MPADGTCAGEFAEFLSKQTIRGPKIDIIANTSALPHMLEGMTGSLVDHLVRPVRWLESVLHLLEQGPLLFQEVGPGRVLSSLFRQIVAFAPCSTGEQQ